MNDFEQVSPPVDGLHQAMTAARTRRLRTLGAGSGVAAIALVAVTALAAGASPGSGLLLGTRHEQPAVGPQHVPSTRPGVRSEASPVQAGAGPAASAGSISLGQGTGPAPANHPPVAGGRVAPSAPSYLSPALTRNDGGVLLPDPACQVNPDGSRRSSSLCTSVRVTSVTGGYSLYGDICSAEPANALLHYATSREVDLVVYRSGHEVWRWSRGHRFSQHPHTLAVTTGHCVGWQDAWTGVDNDGRRLPTGSDYLFVAQFAAAEVADSPTSSTTFSIS